MHQFKPLILLAALIVAATLWQRQTTEPAGAAGAAAPTSTVIEATAPEAPFLPALMPAEARITLDKIGHGGPFEHAQDGVVFSNYEGLLPKQPRGYYHEYTVDTPGAHDRGARRIITGGVPPAVYYYTDDHYRSFRRFEWAR